MSSNGNDDTTSFDIEVFIEFLSLDKDLVPLFWHSIDFNISISCRWVSDFAGLNWSLLCFHLSFSDEAAVKTATLGILETSFPRWFESGKPRKV